MVMNPRTHPRGGKPDFDLPKPNPNPSRMTDALWWLVCMREALEPSLSENGGTFANKPGSHNAGENLRDYGQGDSRTDHSIRDAFNRSGPWWKTKCAAHDWTFRDAQRGDYSTISKYTKRLISAMKDEGDSRPDAVYFYTIGQADNDKVVEGWNERDDDPETGDSTHLWHRHDSFRRNIIGEFSAMWKALTIDMGWTYAEWQKSVGTPTTTPGVKMIEIDSQLPELRQGDEDGKGRLAGFKTQNIKRAQAVLAWLAGYEGKIDGDYGPKMAAAVKKMMADDPKRTTTNGSRISGPEFARLYGLW